MSDSVRPHRRQPTRLPCPWDSSGKNTGVGCHFLLQYDSTSWEIPEHLEFFAKGFFFFFLKISINMEYANLFHKARKWKCQSLSHVQLFATPWIVARQAPLSMGFSGQEYWILEWATMPFSRGSSHPEIEPVSPESPALAVVFFFFF